jgi:hypothetical protein
MYIEMLWQQPRRIQGGAQAVCAPLIWKKSLKLTMKFFKLEKIFEIDCEF